MTAPAGRGYLWPSHNNSNASPAAGGCVSALCAHSRTSVRRAACGGRRPTTQSIAQPAQRVNNAPPSAPSSASSADASPAAGFTCSIIRDNPPPPARRKAIREEASHIKVRMGTEAVREAVTPTVTLLRAQGIHKGNKAAEVCQLLSLPD